MSVRQSFFLKDAAHGFFQPHDLPAIEAEVNRRARQLNIREEPFPARTVERNTVSIRGS